MSSERLLMTSLMSRALLTADPAFSDSIRTQLLTAASPGLSSILPSSRRSATNMEVVAWSVNPIVASVRVSC